MRTAFGVDEYMAETRKLRKENTRLMRENARMLRENARLGERWLTEHDAATVNDERAKLATVTAALFQQQIMEMG